MSEWQTRLRADILAYYSDLGAPFADKKDPGEWRKVRAELTKLKTSPAAGGSEWPHP